MKIHANAALAAGGGIGPDHPQLAWTPDEGDTVLMVVTDGYGHYHVTDGGGTLFVSDVDGESPADVARAMAWATEYLQYEEEA